MTILSVRFVLLLLSVASVSLMAQRQSSADTCEINGQTFRRGESVGDNFEIRCGPWQEWPCYCNPDVLYQVECPYCGFASNTKNLVRCAAHGEWISFIDLADNRGRNCTCDASEPTRPKGTCYDAADAEYCSFYVDGETYMYDIGEEVNNVAVNPCGSLSKYPCYCNPNVEGQLNCPYCTVTNGDTTECLLDKETKRFNIFGDGGKACECDYSLRKSFNFPANSSCDAHYGCAVEEASGEITFYTDGESIEGKTGICGSNYPFICDRSAINTVDFLAYPYCQFTVEGGTTKCVKDGDTISFIDENGKNVECKCEASSLGPKVDCTTIPQSTLTDLPTQSPIDPPSSASIVSVWIVKLFAVICSLRVYV